MTINIHEHIINVKDENEQLIRSTTSVTYMLYPAEGKMLRNKKTGLTSDTCISTSRKSDIVLYEEIDKN